MVDKIDIDRVEYALDLAKEYIDGMILDGSDMHVIFSVFGLGFGALAHIEEMNKETFLEGCSIIYDQMANLAVEFPKKQ
jgi:hypothetical protein